MNRMLPTLCAGLALAFAMSAANADDHRREHFDNRFNHGHYYPNRGVVYGALPGGALGVRYRGGDWTCRACRIGCWPPVLDSFATNWPATAQCRNGVLGRASF